MIIIDARDAILGRMASVAAKELLKGEAVSIVNAEEAVISGRREDILEKYSERRHRKSVVNPARHGVFFPRRPEGIVRRAIRGMLPYKKMKGRNAYKRLRVYIGVPEQFKDSEKISDLPGSSKLRTPRYMKLKTLTEMLGGRI